MADLESAASILLAHIEINPVGNSNLVDINFVSPDADLSAKVVNTWAQEYIQANLDRKFAALSFHWYYCRGDYLSPCLIVHAHDCSF